jgi:hypothetical protein
MTNVLIGMLLGGIFCCFGLWIWMIWESQR